MIPVYAGFDPREEVGYHTFSSSLIHTSSEPVSIIPLHQGLMGKFYDAGDRDGTNSFIYLRFLIPYLQRYTGFAIFMDGADMILKSDIVELWNMRDEYKAVQVVKHDYRTKNPRKYIGTAMEADNRDYPRKNWSSVMILNCGHPAWNSVTPESVKTHTGNYLHRFQFIPDNHIGELPISWNWMPQEHGDNPEAKLIHYTAGVPGFPAHKNGPMVEPWFDALERVNFAIS